MLAYSVLIKYHTKSWDLCTFCTQLVNAKGDDDYYCTIHTIQNTLLWYYNYKVCLILIPSLNDAIHTQW